MVTRHGNERYAKFSRPPLDNPAKICYNYIKGIDGKEYPRDPAHREPLFAAIAAAGTERSSP